MGHSPELKTQKAQATLEFTVMFVIMAVLLLGLIGMWKWSAGNLVLRQKAYNATRISAGSDSPGASYGFSPRALEDNDVPYLK